MSPSDDFYALLSSLLQQTVQNPDAPTAIPLNRWPAGSPEQFLLEDLQAALAALQTGNQNHPSQSKEKEWRYQSIFETTSDGLILNDLETGLVVEANPAACTMYGYTRDEFIGLHPTSFIHPDSSHQFTRYVQSVQSQGMYVALQVHMRRDGSQFYVELNGTVYTDQGHSYLLSIVRDVSQRVHSEQLLQKRVGARTREQSTLLEISQTLASTLELQPGLILDQLRVIIDYTHAGLFKLEDSTLVALAMRGPRPLERAMPFQIGLQNPEVLTMLFNERRSTRIADVQSSDPPARFLRSLLDDLASILLEGVQSWMWVPLAIKGRVIGAIGVAHVERNYFTAHHADLALTVANQAAITMVNAELYEHAQTLAALQERQRLARNLHDAINQSLFSAGLIAEVLPRLWERDPDEGRRSLEDLRRLTRGAQADMRLLLAELRPATLTDSELGDLLRLLGNALAGRTNIPVSVTVAGEGRLSSDVKEALYRLCQEGLNNIAKHAGASRVDIQLQYETDAVELRIRDDGRGFEPEQTTPGHYGLSMMHERATTVGATLSITSQPGHGTEIVIRRVETQEQKAGSMSPSQPIRVMLVHDHTMVRRGLATFLKVFDDLELAGEADSGEAAVQLCAQVLPDVVLMDLMMPDMDGVTATRLIRQQFPKVQVVALTSFKEQEVVQNALQAGAIGYLLKDVSADELARAIRAAHSGRATLSPEAAQALVNATNQPPMPGQDLTERERAVLALMVEGLNNTQIAGRLVVRPSTIKTHVSHILSKLGVASRTEAVALAIRRRLLP